MISLIPTIFSFFLHGIFAMTHSINESLPSDSSLWKYKRRWRSNLIYDYDAAAYIIAIYLMSWESGGSFSQKITTIIADLEISQLFHTFPMNNVNQF